MKDVLKYIINQIKFGRPSYLKYPKIIASEEFLIEVPDFNVKIKVNERDKVKRREEIFDKIIKQIPDINKQYISYDPVSNGYLIKEDKKNYCIPDDNKPLKKKYIEWLCKHYKKMVKIK